MAEIFKTAREASQEVRSTGQTGDLVDDTQPRMERPRNAIALPVSDTPAVTTPAPTPVEASVNPLDAAYERFRNKTGGAVDEAYAAYKSRTRPAEREPVVEEPVQGDPKAGIVSDTGNLLGIGVNSLALNVRELIGRIPGAGEKIVQGLDAIDKWAQGTSSEELLKGNIKQAQERLSPEMIAAQKKDWWDSDKKTLGPAWADPRSYYSGVMQSLPETAVTMLPPVRLAQGVYAAKVAAGVSKEAAGAAAARAAAVSGGISEGLLAGAASSREVRDKVMEMKQEDLENSDAYRTLVLQGMDPQEARASLANDIATQAFVTAGTVTGVFGGIGDKFLAKSIIEGVGKNFLTRGLKGGLKEGVLEELPQEYGATVAENVAMQRADDRVGTFDDALNRGLGGAATGAVQGGAMSSILGKNAPSDQRIVTSTDRNVTVSYPVDDKGQPLRNDTDQGTVNASQMDTARGQFALTPSEFSSATQSTSFMAAAYAQGDDTTRILLQRANPELDLDTLSRDQELVAEGQAFINESPAFFKGFSSALADTTEKIEATDLPFDPSDTSDNPAPRFTPTRANMGVAKDLAAQGIDEAEGTLVRNKPTPSNEQETLVPGPTETSGQTDSATLLDGYSREARNIEETTDPARRRYLANQAMTSMIRNGFTFDDANAMFGQYLSQDQAAVDAAPAPTETVSERLQNFQKIRKNLIQQDNKKWGVQSTEADYQPANLTPAIYKIADLFGVKVVGYKYTGKDKKMARRHGLASPDGIALNVGSRDQFLTVFGHEVYHILRQRDKAAASDLEQRVTAYIAEEGQQALRTKLENIGYSADKITEETVADVMGIMFQDPRFWEQLGQEKPSLLQKIVRVIDDMIRRFGQLGTRQEEVALYISEMDAVRDMMSDFVSQSLDKQAAAAETNDAIEISDDPVGQFRSLAAAGDKASAAKVFNTAKLRGQLGDFNTAFTEAAKPVEQAAPVEESVVPFEQGASRQVGDNTYQGTYTGKPFVEPTDIGTARETDKQRTKRVVAQASDAQKTYSDGVARAIINRDLDSKGESVVSPALEYEFMVGDRVVGKVFSAGGKYYRFNINPDGGYNFGKADSVGAVIAKPPKGATMRRVREGLDPQQVKMDLEGNRTQANKYRAEVQRIMTQAFTPSRVAKDLAELRQALSDQFKNPFFDRSKDRSDVEYVFKMFADVGAIASDEVKTKNEEIDTIKGAIERLQNDDVRARAGMLKVNAAKVEDALESLREEMLKDGISAQQAEEIVGPALDSLTALQENNNAEAILTETGNEVSQDTTLDLPSKDFSDARQSAAAAVDEIVNGKQSPLAVLRRELNKPDRSFSFSDLRKEMAARGMDISEIDREVAQWPAAQYSLAYWVQKNARVMSPYAARQAWFNSHENIMAIYKDDADLRGQYEAELSEVEKRFIESMRNERRLVKNRRTQTLDQYGEEVADSKSAFPHALFNKYRLNDLRNLDESNISEEDAAVLRSLVGGNSTFLPRLWLDDVAYAIDARKDLRPQILEGLTKQERQAVERYLDLSASAIANNERISALRSYSTMLENIQGLDEAAYEAFKKQIINADLRAIPSLLHRAQVVASEAAQAKNKKELGAVLSAYLERVYAEDELSSRTLDESKDAFDQIAGRGTPEVTQEEVDEYVAMMTRQGQPLIDPADAKIELLYQKIAEASTGEITETEADENETAAPETDQPENQAGLSGDIQYKRGSNSSGPAATMVQAHIAELTMDWKRKPNVQVFYNVDQIADRELRARLTARVESGAFKGAIDPETGAVYIFSQHLEDLADAEFVLFHELYGHWGLRAFLGDKLNAFLENQYRLNKKVKAEADRQFDAALEDGSPMSRIESIEEAISDMAANGEPSLFRQLIGQLVNWLRKNNMSVVADWIDSTGSSELAYILSAARNVARTGEGIAPFNGAPSGVLYARKRGDPVEMFAARDGRVTGYARINPIDGNWTVFTMKSEGETGIITVEDITDAIDTLKKVGRVSRAKDRSTRNPDMDPTRIETIPDQKDLVGWAKWKRNFKMGVVNSYLPIFEVAQFLESKGIKSTVINDFIKYEGRLGWFVKSFEKEYARPIQRALKALGDKGATLEDAQDYLYARHAQERNEYINTIDPKNFSGSGLSTKDAKAMLAKFEQSPFAAELETLGELTDKMSKSKLNYMLQTGLITKLEFERVSRYKHYVNLSGNQELGLDAYDQSMLGGRAFNLKGRDLIRSTGRGTKAVDLLQNTMNSYVATLMRGQKNIPMTAFLTMAEQNLDSTFVQINPLNERKQLNLERLNLDKQILKSIGDAPTDAAGREVLRDLKSRVESGEIDTDDALGELAAKINEAERRRDIDSATAIKGIRNLSEAVITSGRLSPDGYVSMIEDTSSLMNNQNVLVAKVKGIPIMMRFERRADEVVQAITGNGGSPNALLDAFGKWNRFFSQMVTSWNPAWIPVNLIRDLMTAFSNAATDPRVGAKLAKDMAKEWGSMLNLAYRYTLSEQAELNDNNKLREKVMKKPLTEAERELIESYLKDGGGTFFMDRDGLEQSLDKLNRVMSGPQTTLQWTQDKLENLTDFLDRFANPSEMAARLAAYKVLRENGWSSDEASRFGKELTVNFNAKGNIGWLRSLFVFFNPAVQGTVRMFQDYSRSDTGIGKYMPSNRFLAISGSFMALGMLSAMLARAFGGEDEELPGVQKFDQIPNFRRNTSFVIVPGMIGGSIPVAYGWNVFMAAGSYLWDAMTGNMKPEVAAMRVAGAAFDSFAPIGSGSDAKTTSSFIAKTITPSALMPFTELAINENRFGAPIFKEQSPFSDVKEANAYMHFDRVNPISKALMHGLASITSDGNPRYRPGLIDWNPAIADHLITSYLPGLFSEVYKGAGTAINAAEGRNVKDPAIPLLDRFNAKPSQGFAEGAMRRITSEVDTVFKEFYARDTSPERRQQIVDQHPHLGAAKAIVTSVNQELRKLSSTLKDVETNPNISDAQKVAFRNQTEERKQAFTRQLVNAAMRSGFKDAVLDNNAEGFIGKAAERIRK